MGVELIERDLDRQGQREPGRQTIEGVVLAWLHEAYQRSHSPRTLAGYRRALAGFRSYLLYRVGWDLDASDTRALAVILQAWAASPRAKDGQPVASATQAQRVACVSSFYRFAKKYGLTTTAGATLANPAELVVRPAVQPYRAARPLDPEDVARRLGAMDRIEPSGARDYALLLVALTTGRRVAELAALTWRDVERSGSALTLTFPRCKGNKEMRDELAPHVAAAVLDWLRIAYGDVATLAADAPLWPSLARPSRNRPPHGMTPRAIEMLCERRLGVSKAHALRHSFAVAMERAGAPLSTIQRRLGHSSAATTSRYLEQLGSAANPYAASVAALFTTTPRRKDR